MSQKSRGIPQNPDRKVQQIATRFIFARSRVNSQRSRTTESDTRHSTRSGSATDGPASRIGTKLAEALTKQNGHRIEPGSGRLVGVLSMHRHRLHDALEAFKKAQAEHRSALQIAWDTGRMPMAGCGTHESRTCFSSSGDGVRQLRDGMVDIPGERAVQTTQSGQQRFVIFRRRHLAFVNQVRINTHRAGVLIPS